MHKGVKDTTQNKGHGGRPRSARTASNIETLRRRLEESPRKSLVIELCSEIVTK
jgi:hypothetical protein